MLPLRRLPFRLKQTPLRSAAQVRRLYFKDHKYNERAASLPQLPIADALTYSPVKDWVTVLPRSDGQSNALMQKRAWVLPRLVLRDMCTCPRCVDQSTRQKLFSTVEIPRDIAIKQATELPDSLEIEWENDLPGFEAHKSVFSKDLINRLSSTGSSKDLPPLPSRRLWNDSEFRAEVPDMTYEAYMQDDRILYQALQTLHSHGLLFLKDVPESAESVNRIAERIGPLKNTFYGETWDVRSVPQAKNVAYTSQDLGFHMDLLYMKQPPHLQFLHCIRSSANGGASLFTDSFKAIKELYETKPDHFAMLERRQMTFHYDHIDSHYYQQSRPLIELAPLRLGASRFPDFEVLRRTIAKNPTKAWMMEDFKLEDYLEAVSWAPPFQAPYQIATTEADRVNLRLSGALEVTLRRWHVAASKFNNLIHQKENIHERMMKPGECVLFDNRRVLHARKAFEVADAGKERWLRGAYLDKDPFMSKLRVLAHHFQNREPGLEDDMRDHEDLRANAAAAAA